VAAVDVFGRFAVDVLPFDASAATVYRTSSTSAIARRCRSAATTRRSLRSAEPMTHPWRQGMRRTSPA
jgi:hypothetical protein